MIGHTAHVAGCYDFPMNVNSCFSIIFIEFNLGTVYCCCSIVNKIN